MSNAGKCHLTTKDLHTLEDLLERGVDHDAAFLRLLRRKLSTAVVVFPDDIDPRIATVNSTIDFSVDGIRSEDRILVPGEERLVSGTPLPITTMHGLALLGLMEDEAIVVEGPDGRSEEIRLDRVTYQPEAARADRLHRPVPAGREARTEAASSVVAFTARPRPASASRARMPFDPDDDDPGPRAA